MLGVFDALLVALVCTVMGPIIREGYAAACALDDAEDSHVSRAPTEISQSTSCATTTNVATRSNAWRFRARQVHGLNKRSVLSTTSTIYPVLSLHKKGAGAFRRRAPFTDASVPSGHDELMLGNALPDAADRPEGA